MSQDRFFEIIFDKDELNWRSMLQDLVRSENMDPWDVDVSVLSKRFFDMIHQMQETDLRISGKIILAAAILVKMKSNKLVGEDIMQLDRLFAQSEESEEEEGLLDDLNEQYRGQREALRNVGLIPRTPQPRKRKVSIYDLIGALQKAMEVKKRRVMRDIPSRPIEIPKKKVDISALITDVFGKIKRLFLKSNSRLTFSQLVVEGSKESQVFTFIPLLHLTNQRKIDLHQRRHFGEIEIELLKSTQKQEVSKQ